MSDAGAPDLRFLILAPTTKDAEITTALLRGAGIATESCHGLESLVETATAGAA